MHAFAQSTSPCKTSFRAHGRLALCTPLPWAQTLVCALPRARHPHDAAVSGRWWGRCWIKFDSSPYSTAKHSRAVIFVLEAPFAPPNAYHTPATSTPARASLSLGRTRRSSQTRSVRPLSRPLRPPCRHPACGALLLSLDLYTRSRPSAPQPSCRTSTGNAEKRPCGSYPPGLSTMHRPPVTLFFFFDVSPSRYSNAASSQHLRTIALSTWSLLRITATHANGWLKSRETTVSRHLILLALFQDHRVLHAANGREAWAGR
ncbi:hypothetical protein K438DRAFT_1848046, partial [Mycena galopus ATCC 62051]